ncbi:cell wall-binding repeat-containing protein [Euzebya sp.]|uniref:cell wall-binding repeat-containing protein n=1 Tax=Euzebya sp. TaxID=1971409 RepID=UPI00351258E4
MTSTARARSWLAIIAVTAVAVLAPVAPTAADPAPPATIEVVDVAGPAFASAGWSASQPMAVSPFAMVGITLDDAGEGAVQVRTAQGDGPWSDWIDVPHMHDEGPDPGTAEARHASPGHRTHPVFTDVADRLQVRVADGSPAGLKAHLIDPFGLDRSVVERIGDRLRASWDGVPTAAAGALADTPRIVSRAAWGADESSVRGDPSYARSVERAFVHHTVGSNDYSQAQAPGIVRGVMAYHVGSNGWSDIGYNFLVDRFGTVYEGRRGGIAEAVIGAQAGGFNTESTGVALMGTYTSASPPAAMLDAAERIIAWKADVHHFHPLRDGQATSMGSSRYPEGAVVTLQNVSGHRDVSLTSCPGDATYARLGAIRQRVREAAGDLIVDLRSDQRSIRVIRGTPVVPSLTLGADLDPPGTWRIELLDPQGRTIHTADGEGAVASTTVDLTGGGWALGTYEWVVSAPGRLSAVEQVTFTPPVITGFDRSTDLARADRDGTLREPVAFHADLWEGASWQLVVTDPSGAVVHTSQGVGAAMDTGWFGGVTRPGTHTATVTAEDAAPVTTTLEVRYDLFDRVADTPDAIGGTTALSAAAFPDGTADHAVIARHDVFADALAGGPLAGRGGPLLLTTPDQLDPRVAVELDRVLAEDAVVYVLGGPAAIGEEVLADLVARHGTVIRVAGDTRTATAAAIADLVVAESGTTTAMVARAGPDDASPWADALAGGAYGAHAGVPVLLTATDVLSPETADAIDDLDIEEVIVLGGTAAVGDAVLDDLPDPRRLAGGDRTGTGVAVAEQLWGAEVDVARVLLANGFDAGAWGWALAAAPLAAQRRAPLLVTTATTLSPAVAAHLAATPAVEGGTVVGPSSLVDPEVGYAASAIVR